VRYSVVPANNSSSWLKYLLFMVGLWCLWYFIRGANYEIFFHK
jgi:hypothetical protein